jgi:glycosyltransferase involved in cell wall biosynthesis
VVGSAVSGISFMMLDGVTGVLVPPRQAQDLATALARLDQDCRATAAMAASALERSSLFRWTANTNALLELCQPGR